jgi:hypothetical protein
MSCSAEPAAEIIPTMNAITATTSSGSARCLSRRRRSL